MKNAEGEKVGKKSKKVENNYVNDRLNDPDFFGQKPTVEKPVESVEKSILSTKNGKIERMGGEEKSHFFEKTAA